VEVPVEITVKTPVVAMRPVSPPQIRSAREGVVASLTEKAQRVAFSPKGRYAVAGSRAGLAYVIDVVAGEVRRRLDAHVGEVTGVAFAPDGRRFYTAGKDGHIRTWEVDGAELGTEIVNGPAVTCFALTPDGQRFVAGLANGTARLYDVQGSKQ